MNRLLPSVQFDPELLRQYDQPLPRYTSYPPATQYKALCLMAIARNNSIKVNAVDPNQNSFLGTMNDSEAETLLQATQTSEYDLNSHHANPRLEDGFLERHHQVLDPLAADSTDPFKVILRIFREVLIVALLFVASIYYGLINP